MQTKIEVKNLNLYFGEKQALKKISLAIPENSIVALIGPSGCGKSTLLRSLNRMHDLNPAVRMRGEILLDGRRVNKATRDEYRELFSAIFFDYHLFRRLYGVPDVDPAELRQLLTKFRLEDKTGLINGEFRTLDLSGGQRRRLALIVSLLEDRPIMLLDEWTA
ncbi:MAG TPA: ATP-binding cassette domain-containing protein, partial [Saprospiraceae bacterium]|nr:ATP-binding cassette domain-containing protein [Saprospiraceae bacterium]